MFEAVISHFTFEAEKKSNRIEQEPALIEIDRSQRQPKEALLRAAQQRERSIRAIGGRGERDRRGARARERERERERT